MKNYNYIYLITNNINGKIYVGKHSTDNLNDGYMGSGKLIKLAYNKYGIENFTKKILAFADTEEKLNWFERYYIKKYNARTNGYNLTDGGDGTLGHFGFWNGKVGPNKGKQSPMKGKAPWNKGKTGVQTAWNKGKHHSEETKQKISEAGKGRKAWNKGKTISEEQKRKISETLKRKKEAI